MYHIVHKALTALTSASTEWIAISSQTKAESIVGSACQTSLTAPAVHCNSSFAFMSHIAEK